MFVCKNLHSSLVPTVPRGNAVFAIAPIYDGLGAVAGAAVVARDISVRKAAQQAVGEKVVVLERSTPSWTEPAG